MSNEKELIDIVNHATRLLGGVSDYRESLYKERLCIIDSVRSSLWSLYLKHKSNVKDIYYYDELFSKDTVKKLGFQLNAEEKYRKEKLGTCLLELDSKYPRREMDLDDARFRISLLEDEVVDLKRVNNEILGSECGIDFRLILDVYERFQEYEYELGLKGKFRSIFSRLAFSDVRQIKSCALEVLKLSDTSYWSGKGLSSPYEVFAEEFENRRAILFKMDLIKKEQQFIKRYSDLVEKIDEYKSKLRSAESYLELLFDSLRIYHGKIKVHEIIDIVDTLLSRGSCNAKIFNETRLLFLVDIKISLITSYISNLGMILSYFSSMSLSPNAYSDVRLRESVLYLNRVKVNTESIKQCGLTSLGERNSSGTERYKLEIVKKIMHDELNRFHIEMPKYTEV